MFLRKGSRGTTKRASLDSWGQAADIDVGFILLVGETPRPKTIAFIFPTLSSHAFP